jgi:diaminobutyrate-2-oxoglutarate transaminase
MHAVFVRAANARVWDEDGNEYIDFLSACGSLNYGHNHPAMKARVIAHLAGDGLLNGLDLHTAAKRAFLRAFREVVLAPRGLRYRVQFTGPTGTNSVEAALKLARKITGRRSVVAFTNAFHGMTLGALAAGARHQHRSAAGVDLDGVVRLPYDGYHDAGTRELERYEAMVRDPSGGAEPPAAFIVETIQGEGGLNAARAEWLQHLAATAKRLGALLVVDDVQAGCGRTGDFFSFERMRIEPDLVCLAKSISGIGLPMAVLLIKPEHDQWSPGEHNGTFRGNNLAFVAATAALELWRDPEFMASIARSVDIVQSWLDATVAVFAGEGACRKGRGLFAGVAFADHALARRVAAEAFRRRLMIETSGPYGEVVKILPPLTIEPDVLREGLGRLHAAIEEALAHGRLRAAA